MSMHYEKPPLGPARFLPTHDHSSEVICGRYCPVRQWDDFVKAHGNPFDRLLEQQNQPWEYDADTYKHWKRRALDLLERAWEQGEKDQWFNALRHIASASGAATAALQLIVNRQSWPSNSLVQMRDRVMRVSAFANWLDSYDYNALATLARRELAGNIEVREERM
jgi:hypothetical protein